MNTVFTLIELGGIFIVIAAAAAFGSFDVDFYEMPPSVSGSVALSVGTLMAGAGLVFSPTLALRILPIFPKRQKTPTGRFQERY
jgi:hypothetical protein